MIANLEEAKFTGETTIKRQKIQLLVVDRPFCITVYMSLPH